MTTSSPQVEAAVTAMRLGALDVLTTPVDQEHLLQVVRDGLRRDVHIGPSLEGGERKVELRGFAQLTNREREVLQLITDGNSNKTAAKALGISDRTAGNVKTGRAQCS